jgi:transcriptional regulator with XRE-family HTH domain
MNKQAGPTEQYIQDKREAIGKQIRAFREKKGFSVDELSEIMEVKHATIIKIETGKFAITIDYLTKFAWYLEFNISLLEKQSKQYD